MSETRVHTVMCSNCDRELMRDECVTYPESPQILHCPNCFEPLTDEEKSHAP